MKLLLIVALFIYNRKIAKLCAMTLCNMSLEPKSEGIMARDGAILALVILLGVKGQRLLPTCVHALYNLSCAENYYKGMERIIKAILNVPQTNFDSFQYAVRVFVNCARFSWMRLRIIEDGALSSMAAVVPSLPMRENAAELVGHMVTCVRLLSDSVVCRTELLAKGTLDLLYQLIPYCNEEHRLSLMRSLFNLLQAAVSMPIFETAVMIVTGMCSVAEDTHSLQYISACLMMFCRENLRGSTKLAIRAVDSLPKLLEYDDKLTHFFAIVSAAHLFFINLW